MERCNASACACAIFCENETRLFEVEGSRSSLGSGLEFFIKKLMTSKMFFQISEVALFSLKRTRRLCFNIKPNGEQSITAVKINLKCVFT